MNRLFSALPSFVRSQLTAWLSPTTPGDEVTPLARGVRLMLQAALIGEVFAAIILALTDQFPQIWIMLVSALFLAAAGWLAIGGRIRLAGLLGLINFTVLAAVLLALGDGLLDIAILLYPAIIIGSVLLLDRRQFVGLMAWMLLLLSLVFIGQITGWIDSLQPDVERQYSDFAMAVLILSATAISTQLVAENLRSSLNRLAESEARYRALVEQTSVVIYRDAPEPGCPAVYVSPRIESLLGYSPDEWVRDPFLWQRLLHSEDRERALAHASDFNLSEDVSTLEYRLQARDGRWVWIQDESVVVRDPHGRPLYVQGVYHDVTRQREAEAALLESEARLRRAIQEAPHPIQIHADDGQVLALNRAWTDITGYTLAEIPTIATWVEHAYPDRREAILAEIGQLYSLNGRLEEGEEVIRTRSGDLRTWRFSSAPLGQLPDGRRLVISMAVDLTERQKTEQALRASEERFRHLAEALPDTVYVIDTIHSRPTFFNRDDFLGYSRAELDQRQSVFHAVHPDDAERVSAYWWEATRGQASAIEFRVQSKSGAWEWIQQRAVVLEHKPDRTPLEVMFILTNITRRKQAEAELRRHSEQVAALNEIGRAVTMLQAVPQTLEVIHTQVKRSLPLDVFFVGLYDEATNLLAFPIVYDGGQRYLEPASPLPAHTNTRRTIETGQPLLINRSEAEIKAHVLGRFALGDKNKPSASLLFAPLHVGQRVIGVVSAQSYTLGAYSAEHLAWLTGVAHFATIAIENARLFEAQQREARERQLAEETVRQLNLGLEQRVFERTAELETANRELESVSYTIAHDLRIPARAMHGFAHILKEKIGQQLDAESTSYLTRIILNARRLGQLIDDLLAFMRLNRAPVRRQTVNMASLVARILHDLNADLMNRTIQARVADLPECQADPDLAAQVWLQLLSNAFKFTRPRAEAVIEIAVQLAEEGKVYIVRDNGIGFDMQYAHKLFGAFQRLHSFDEFEGTGMGLAIARRIVQRHGGRIWADAKPDQGATFYFTLGSTD